MADTTTPSTATQASGNQSSGAAASPPATPPANPGQVAPIGSKAQTDAAAANAANAPASDVPASLADTVKPGDGSGAGDKPQVTAEQLKALDESNADPSAAGGQAEVQARVDKETTNGYRGTHTDPTPNEHYTFGGQAKGLPTPETHPDYAAKIGNQRFAHLGELDGTTDTGDYDADKADSDKSARAGTGKK